MGAYVDTNGFYGTFDQAGNVFEWNETVISSSLRGLRGGGHGGGSTGLEAFDRRSDPPGGESDVSGFRVASIPEPNTCLLVAVGSLIMLSLR